MKNELHKKLFVAVATNDLKTVQAITADGFSHDSLWDRGNATIHLAIDERNLKIFQYLLQTGVDPNVQNEQFSDTPLHQAAHEGYLDMVKMLLAHGADPSVKDNAGVNPLYNAVSSGHLEIATLFVKAGVDIHDLPDRLGNLLAVAVSGSKNDKMTEYLLKLGIDANEYRGGNHPLTMAVWEFVACKLYPSLRSRKSHNPRNVELLLQAGADPNLPIGDGIGKDYAGKTTLEIAKEAGISPSVIKMLSTGGTSTTTAKAGTKTATSKIKGKSGVKAKEDTATVPSSIADAWKQLEKTLAKKAPEIRRSLVRKATEKQIAALRKDVKQAVPEEFIESLQTHNGQVDAAPYLIPGEWTRHEYQLLKIDGILCERRAWQELVDAGEFRGQVANSDSGVRSAWFSPGWIPFATDGAGNCLCVDTNPLKKGTVGQIVSVDHETADRKRLASSMKEFLAKLNDYWTTFDD